MYCWVVIEIAVVRRQLDPIVRFSGGWATRSRRANTQGPRGRPDGCIGRRRARRGLLLELLKDFSFAFIPQLIPGGQETGDKAIVSHCKFALVHRKAPPPSPRPGPYMRYALALGPMSTSLVKKVQSTSCATVCKRACALCTSASCSTECMYAEEVRQGQKVN